jgi:ParB-like chromosome segregation protein Spo0J
MTDSDQNTAELSKTIIRICPACGVVNPSGPSESCPHLQLAKFDGIDQSMVDMLEKVAKARREFSELLGELKQQVKQAINEGEAEVEASPSVRLSDIESLKPRTAPRPKLSLESPEPPSKSSKTSKPRSPRGRKPAGPPKVDPRQLELIARAPPKGHA